MTKLVLEYFYGTESEQFTFYRIPKLLITSPVFKKVSDSAKILYGLMLDRMSLSIKNGWLDEENRAYIFFTVNDVMEYMNCGTEKATKMLAELDSKKGIGLIERKKQGQGKPAIVYLKKFVVEDSSNRNQDFRESKSKNFENRNSRLPKTESADFRETKCNYNNINNTELSDTDISNHIASGCLSEESVSLCSNDVMRWIDERRDYEKLIKQNIDYDGLVGKFGSAWLDEIVSLMVDVVCSKEPYIRINKQDYPHEVVKSRFLKINSDNIEYVNFALQNNTSDVCNIRAFLITTIYRSTETMDNWYTAKVQHDMST